VEKFMRVCIGAQDVAENDNNQDYAIGPDCLSALPLVTTTVDMYMWAFTHYPIPFIISVPKNL
jgi:hypothetical protein